MTGGIINENDESAVKIHQEIPGRPLSLSHDYRAYVRRARIEAGRGVTHSLTDNSSLVPEVYLYLKHAAPTNKTAKWTSRFRVTRIRDSPGR